MEENNNEVKNEVKEEKVEAQAPVENTTVGAESQQTQQASKQPKKNNYLPLIIIVVVFFAALIGGFLLFEAGVFNEYNKVKNKVEKEMEKIEEIDNNNEQKQENDQISEVSTDEKIHTSYVEKGEEFDKVYSQIQGRNGITIRLNSDGKSVDIELYQDTIKEHFGIDIGVNSFKKTISFDRKVKQLLFGEFGQATGGECILFLMEDGTVEYIQAFKDLSNWNTLSNDQRMNSRGKIAGVNDVVMLFPMSVTSFSGYVSVGAERKDGSFYDLIEFNL